ncbi:MAG: helix-turn-helix domain-containing protein [Oscillospiraceae bacterium]|nr:helix-turn-helix domain-containing protein [Oscillospiraceae bacterium]
MTLPEKLEILIRRKKISKTDFAGEIGITYRALANYISGSRHPRRKILNKMSDSLSVTPEFLLDDKKNLILDSEERFFHYAESEGKGLSEAAALLEKVRGVFYGDALSEKDKQSLYACVAEMYFDARTN